MPSQSSSPSPEKGVATFDALQAAYLRGAQWHCLYGDDPLLTKAAYDYADARCPPTEPTADANLLTDLQSALGWVQHWQDDVAADVLPTRSSLSECEASIRAAIARAEGV